MGTGSGNQKDTSIYGDYLFASSQEALLSTQFVSVYLVCFLCRLILYSGIWHLAQVLTLSDFSAQERESDCSKFI